MKSEIAPVIRILKQSFGKRLLSVIGYGSFFDTSPSPADIDVIIVLQSRVAGDVSLMRSAWLKKQSILKVDCQFIYLDELQEYYFLYSQYTHGPYYLKVIAERGHILYGKNIIKTLPRPHRLFSTLSLLQKVQQYLYTQRNFLINYEVNDPKHIERFVKKKLRCLYEDAEIFFGNNKTFIHLLDPKERQLLRNILKIKQVPQTGQKLLLASIDINEKLYTKMLSRIKNDYLAA